MKRNTKRILTDAAGYLLIIAAALTGPLPGPGGIPLLIAGLSVLSINNEWAKRLRGYLLEHGGKVVELMFPPKRWVELAYDAIAVLLFVLCIVLEIRHAAMWQVSLGIVAFFFACFIALMNRDRLNRLKGKPKRKR